MTFVKITPFLSKIHIFLHQTPGVSWSQVASLPLLVAVFSRRKNSAAGESCPGGLDGRQSRMGRGAAFDGGDGGMLSCGKLRYAMGGPCCHRECQLYVNCQRRFFLEGGNVIFGFFLEGISEYPVDFLKMS